MVGLPEVSTGGQIKIKLKQFFRRTEIEMKNFIFISFPVIGLLFYFLTIPNIGYGTFY